MDILKQYPQLNIIIQLAKRKKTPIFLVGGFLRDSHLGKASMDFDFAVQKGALALARQFARQIKGAFVLLDDAHGSARVVRREKSQVFTYDFTDFRAKTMEGDLNLRDFTVNTLCLDLSKPAKLIDLHNAQKDLKAKRVRMVASKAFEDDPLRLLRAFSLQALFGFKIDAKTLAQIKKDKERINAVAMERIREEIYKILNSPRAAETLGAMDRIGLLERVIPQLTVMRGVHQGGYHHLDVWKHSLEVLRQLEVILSKEEDQAVLSYFDEEIGGGHTRGANLKMAALLHDIGKPETKKPEGARMTFHGHENVGMRITRLVAKHLKLSVKERYFLEDVVQMHLRPGYLANFTRPSEKAVFRYMRDAGQEAAALAFLGLADQAATCGPLATKAKSAHHAKICRMLIDRFFEVKEKPKAKVRLLTGHDLIKKLKLKPSPLFGKILMAVEEAQALGKISTKEEALLLAQKMR